MDLKTRLEIGGEGLLAMLDADKEFMPTNGYEVAHDLGRWWDAALRLEETIGFMIPGELEAASLRNLQRLTDNPDRLLMNRMDVPWLKDKAKINPHNFRESLLAFCGLVRRRQNMWARDAALHLVRNMDHILQPDGRFDFTKLGSWGHVPHTEDPSQTEEKRHGWFDSTGTSGRALEALVWLFESTGEPSVLDLARRIAEHHLEYSTSTDGSVRDEIVDPENAGHDHSYHGTLRGLFLFGLLTGQRGYVDVVEATYRNAVRNRIVKESGWAPHDLGKDRFANKYGDPVTDPASAGDSAQLAMWLAMRAGCDDLLDDVERLVRARLLPAQMTDDDIRKNPDRTLSPRERGAWSIHGPSHAGKGCTPDVHAAVIHTLCDVHSHILTRGATGVRVNLHFDAENETLKTVSTRERKAVLTVTVKQPDNVLIRIPGWAPEPSIRLTIDGEGCPLRRTGAFAWVPADVLKIGSEIRLSHDLPERSTEEEMPSGRRYRFTWRGDEITGINPQDDGMPFYPSMA
ncbi:MAG: glycoside hydrolase family protein [Planctomycetota bacterium]|jgi:hypothetical protein